MTPEGSQLATDTLERAPVTVIITQRVTPGRDDEFREWHDGVNCLVGTFEGFLGTEVVAPDGEAGEWTVIYRFDSRTNLDAWLSSADRQKILERGAGLFTAEPSQQILMGEPVEDLRTVVVSHPVDAAHEDEFVAWQGKLTEAKRSFPGFRGSELFEPVPGASEEWTSIFRFDTDDHLNGWLESPERRQLLGEGANFTEYDMRRISSPFGSWFSFGDDAAGAEAPANWQSALSVLVGLYPTVVLLTLGLSELWPHGALWETLLVGNILSVGLLTWVVMPVVTRALRFWLAPDPRRAGRRLDQLGAAASIGFLTLAALVFWLVTTQLWTLP